MSPHVAFKCTYNNGGASPYIGFDGTCSDDVINYNLNVRHRPNCNASECRSYWDGGCKGRRPIRPCYESDLFRVWRFGAGWYHTGARADTPIHMSQAEKGKIAVLTTRFPAEPETDRRIVGLFQIGTIEPGSDQAETWVTAERRCRIPLTIEEARAAYFWDFHRGRPRWGTGLFRYLQDEEVKRLALGLRFIIREDKAKRALDWLINTNWPQALTSEPATQALGKTTALARRASAQRKYGSGGEGEDHKRLKKWVAEHPAAIGLRGVTHADIEHVFDCGDTVDILFTHADHTLTVVEIETIDPYPGALQAIKYRAIQCAQLRRTLNSPRVRAVLVAWKIPPPVADLCHQYSVLAIEKRV